MVRNIKLTISYDGTGYFGWQKQLNIPTIQETIEKAIYSITGIDAELIGSGRTDRGVHALGQTANFTADTRIESDKIKNALNAHLPRDIRIINSEDVPLSFNSRFDALNKTYMYQIYNSRTENPFYRNYACFVPAVLNYEKMEKALKPIIGTHDFKGFMTAGSEVKTTVRTVYSAKLIKKNELIRLYITGDGFLYNMVRIIVGTLIDIGKDTKEESCIVEALEKPDRTLLGQTAKPEGLFLKEVCYNVKKLLTY